MRLRIYYFSGTGNARRTALWMADDAQRLRTDARALSIDFGAKPEPLAAGDVIGFVFPVHGFTTIAAMLKFVWAFPRGDRSVAVFAAAVTGACRIGPVQIPGWEGSGLYLPLFLLWLKGYRCVGALPLRSTPENWTSLIPACSEKACRCLMQETNPAASDFIAALLAGKRVFRGLISLLFGMAVLPVSILYLCVGRYFIGKMFFASSRCNGCGLCAEGCPVSAIRMVNDRPFWKLGCESCMRCMNFCPQRAIQASQLLAALVIIYGTGPLANWLTSCLQTHLAFSDNMAGIIGWVASWPLAIAFLVVLYRVWFVLLRWKPVNLFFEYTTLTRWYRRYREPETRIADLIAKK